MKAPARTRPESKTYSVQTLVERVAQGLVRVPEWQRLFKAVDRLAGGRGRAMSPAPEVGSLRILLGDDPVGSIVVRDDERNELSFFRSYLEMHPRPVLGQVFEDDLHRVHRARVALPPFCSNLLPEERLRDLVAAQIGVARRVSCAGWSSSS